MGYTSIHYVSSPPNSPSPLLHLSILCVRPTKLPLPITTPPYTLCPPHQTPPPHYYTSLHSVSFQPNSPSPLLHLHTLCVLPTKLPLPITTPPYTLCPHHQTPPAP